MIFDDLDNLDTAKTKIKVIGVGGAGKNAIDHMIENEVLGVEFYAVNTDAQDLKISKAPTKNKILIGKTTTHGQGAGANPEVGRAAAIENEDDIHEMIGNAQMVFITCGMGGGTGTGAAPVIAKVAREHNCLTVGICTKPFIFEGPARTANAVAGLEAISEYVDTLIVVPNQRLLKILPVGTGILDAFREADNVLRQGVQGIAETIALPGLINIDFADVNTVMKNKGTSLLGIGVGKGPNRAIEAAREAINSALLEVTIDGATDAIVNVTASQGLSLNEVNDAIEEIRNNAGNDINIIFGAAINNDLKDELVVTVVATGYELKAHQSGFNDLREAIFRNMSEENITYSPTRNMSGEKEIFDDNSNIKEDDLAYDSTARSTELFNLDPAKKEKPKKGWFFGKKEKKEKVSYDDFAEDTSSSDDSLPDWLKKDGR